MGRRNQAASVYLTSSSEEVVAAELSTSDRFTYGRVVGGANEVISPMQRCGIKHPFDALRLLQSATVTLRSAD